jgi:hypothetical protein
MRLRRRFQERLHGPLKLRVFLWIRLIYHNHETAMNSAHEIQLNEQELAQLGRLTAILGQVDDLMIQTVERLLSVDRTAANIIMGSSKIADNSAIWASVIKNRTADEDILWLIEHAIKEIGLTSKARNDFIHSVFSRTYSFGFWFVFPAPQTVARRVRNASPRPITDLTSVIDQSARLSCLIAHIDHLVGGNPEATSTWLERLGPTLPPRIDTASERKAKAQRGQMPPSHRWTPSSRIRISAFTLKSSRIYAISKTSWSSA